MPSRLERELLVHLKGIPAVPEVASLPAVSLHLEVAARTISSIHNIVEAQIASLFLDRTTLSAVDVFPASHENGGLVGVEAPNERTRLQIGRYASTAVSLRQTLRFYSIEIDDTEFQAQNRRAQEPFVRKSVYERLLGPSVFND